MINRIIRSTIKEDYLCANDYWIYTLHLAKYESMSTVCKIHLLCLEKIYCIRHHKESSSHTHLNMYFVYCETDSRFGTLATLCLTLSTCFLQNASSNATRFILLIRGPSLALLRVRVWKPLCPAIHLQYVLNHCVAPGRLPTASFFQLNYQHLRENGEYVIPIRQRSVSLASVTTNDTFKHIIFLVKKTKNCMKRFPTKISLLFNVFKNYSLNRRHEYW